ncbi:hypothetical protein COOONC_17452 [Cooperia oncophora]
MVTEIPPNMEKLAQIEKINGGLIVTKNTGVPDLSFLSNLKEILTSRNRTWKLSRQCQINLL